MTFGNVILGAPRWVLPAAVIAAVLLVLVLWSYFRARAAPGVRIAAPLLKLLAIAALVACLIEPLFSGMRPRPQVNAFIILADNSKSMDVETGGGSRRDSWKQLLDPGQPWRTRLEQDFDVRDYAFDAQLDNVAELAALNLDGRASDLRRALETVALRFRRRPTAGVLLLTDGNATDIAEPAPDWSLLGFPIYPVIDDESDGHKDIRIGQVHVTQTNFETSPVAVHVLANCDGYLGQDIVGRLVDEAGTLIEEKVAKAKADGEPVEFRFRFRPESTGLSFCRAQVFAKNRRRAFENNEAGSELTLDNNSRWIAVDRGGGPYRVLYVAGRPNWEFKFLRRAADEDDELHLVGLLRIARKAPRFTFQDRGGVDSGNRLFEGFENKDDDAGESHDEPVLVRLGISAEEEARELRGGFPKSADELFPYHAIILDDIEADFFTPDQKLLVRRFVSQRGGGLLMMGGQESFVKGDYYQTPMGELLPVYVDKSGDRPVGDQYRWRLTREGSLQPWIRVRDTEVVEDARLAQMPPFRSLNRINDVKPGASVLATVQTADDEELPALVTQRFGKGRTGALLIGDMWRWALHRQEGEPEDLQQMWRQTIRWLVADVPRRVRIEAKPPASAGDPVTLQVLVRDAEYKPQDNATVELTVTTPDGDTRDLTAESSSQVPGLYSAQYVPPVEGGYRVKAVVVAPDGEELEPREAGWTSQPAADEFRNLTTNRALLDELAARTGGEVIRADDLDGFVKDLPNRKIPVTENHVYPLWHQPWVMLLAIACLCGEWGLRRWRGLP